jgi:hypothetical protein
VTSQEKFLATMELRDYFEPRVTIKQIADEAGVSRQYVWAVVRQREIASERVVSAAVKLGAVRP